MAPADSDSASSSSSDAAKNEPAAPDAGTSTRQKPNYFGLDRLDAALEFAGEYEQRRVRIDDRQPFGGTRQRNVRQTFDEQFILELDGWVYDQNLLSLSGTIGFGLSQERYRETFNGRADADSNDGYLTSYDLRGDFLTGKAISGTAYGLRSRDRYARPFLPSLREERDDYGAALYWTQDRLPMELTFDHRAADRTGSRRRQDDENLVEDVLRYQATLIETTAHALKLTYEYADTRERFSGSRYQFDNVRNELRLDDELLFGPDRRHRLDTTLRWQDETGDYARDLLELGSRLSLRHTDALDTHYRYQFSREEIGALSADVHRADWELSHRLFTNLTTNVNLFALNERIENDTETWTGGASVDLGYARNNPMGRFLADLALSAESERTRGGGQRLMVNESGAFRDPLPIFLSRPDVLPWSIVVRSSDRRRLYLPGLDYLVQRIGGRTILVRNFLGRIPNGASVSIDYVYRVDRDASLDVERVGLRLRQEFKSGWTPYYDFEFRHEDRGFDNSIFRARQFESQRHRLGVEYRKDRFRAGGEFELLKDNIDPFIAYRAHAASTVYRTPGSTIDLRADFSHYFFETADRGDTLVLDLSCEARTALNARTDAYVIQSYRYEDDGTRGRGVIHGVDLEGGVAHRWGLFTLTASVEYDLLTITDSKEDGLGVWLKVRRDLPDLARVAR